MNRPVGDIPVEPRAGEEEPPDGAIERPRVLLVDDDERNLLAVRDACSRILARSFSRARARKRFATC